MNVYLFDFDGTLVDSMPTYASVMLRILEENGIPYGDDLMKIITPLGFRDTAKYFQSMGVALTPEEMVARMTSYAVDAYTHHVQAKQNVVETLNRLKARGDSMSVLTASPHITLDPCLRRLGIFDLFDNLWSCEDFGTNKANPEIYHMAAAQMGHPIDQILFLDDNCNALKTARDAGMRTCGVYDRFSADYAEEIQSFADYYIRDFAALMSLA